MSKLKLVDYIKINPDPSYADLSRREKVGIVDSLLNRSESRRGLYVTYDLSHSGRRINNRIYTVAGQQRGIDSLLTPYPKPIIKNHDDHDDPIGRFVGGVWDDTSSDALAFFDDVNDYMEVQAAFDADNPKRIYDSMKKYGLLTRAKWPGLGRMRVTAKISDQESIEKFLDGRYITFSAGSTTDRHVCSVCHDDWAKGDICEHRHGKIYDDDLCVFVTGKFEVLEGSVVNMPADDLSQVLSMEMADSVRIEDVSSLRVDKHTVYLTDSRYLLKDKEIEEISSDEKKFKVPESARNNAKKVLEWKKKYGSEVKGMTSVGWARARQLSSNSEVPLSTVKRMAAFNRHRKNAAVDPKFKSEPWKDRGYVAWLGWGGSSGIDWAIKISAANDSSESELIENDKHNFSEKNMSEQVDNAAETEVLVEDSEVLSSEENKTEETETIVSVDASDEVSASDEKATEEVSVDSNTDDKAEDQIDDALVKALVDRVLETVRKELKISEVSDGPVQNSVDASDEKEEKEEAHNIDKTQNDKTEEGTEAQGVLEEVLSFDKPLTTEQRNRLKESTFCGPERSYPVPDKSHAIAALSRAKQHASAELYKTIKSCVCRKADKNGWDLPSCNTDMMWTPELTKEALEKESLIMGWDKSEVSADQELKLDYANALSRIEKLEKQLEDALSCLNENVDKELLLKKEGSEVVSEVNVSDSASEANEEKTSIASGVVENPSIASTDNDSSPRDSAGSKKLGTFEKKVCKEYSQLLEKDGLNFAENYLRSKRRYLRRGFHPKNYIQLGE